MKRPRLDASLRVLGALFVLFLLAACALIIYSYTLPLPVALRDSGQAGLRIEDRQGLLLARLRGAGDVWRQPIEAGDLGPHAIPLLLAAEDSRFWSHPGVDPVAMLRAAGQALIHGRVVSGASTISQQLARTCFARPRTLAGKLHELALSLRIERSLSKREILLAYLNRVEFGPNVLGMAAASERYLGKPLDALDLGETALLLAAVRGPSLYDLERYPMRAKLRRDRILVRAREQGLVPPAVVELALATPVVLRPSPPWPGAWHFARKLARENHGQVELTSTVDWDLQRRAEELAHRQKEVLSGAGVSAVAAVVLSNARAEVLVYVGSHDPTSQRDLGQNDGVQSKRQPGSALKPFVYAAAIDALGYGAETVLPDEPLTFRTTGGHYTPENFDRRFRGPVSLRRALASSLNVPAVFTLERLGIARGLGVLQDFGLGSLGEDAEHYGLGLALGSGEVSLFELAAAYSTLARGGSYLPPRLLTSGAAPAPRQVVSSHAARVITDVLMDEGARSELLGGVRLDHLGAVAPFALKTGTSTGFRDAWAFAYDDELTVGVWVGNFDGRPMVKTSGAAGAAPLAIELLAEARSLTPSPGRSAVHRTGREVGPTASTAWLPSPRITFPAQGARLTLRNRERKSELVVRLAHAPSGARLLVDGRVVPWAAGRAVVQTEPGHHEARLVDAGGLELSAVTFQISG